MLFADAIVVLNQVLAVDPTDERAARWREDLSYLEAQARQADVRQPPDRGKIVKSESYYTTREDIQPGERMPAEAGTLRYPSVRVQDGKDLPESRQDFPRAVAPEPDFGNEAPRFAVGDVTQQAARAEPPLPKAEADDVQTALDEVAKVRRELQTQARELDEVKFNLNNIAGDEDGRRLAEFVASNYSWALNAPAHATQDAMSRDDYSLISPGADRLRGWIGPGNDSDIANFVGFAGQPSVLVAFEAGTNALVVANDPVAVDRLREVLDRLRQNLGQRVGVASRNVFVDAGAARAAGIRWETGANNVRYAVINEGQLLAMMDIEQRAPSAAGGAGLVRDARQEAIVGTDALLANSLPVTVSRAADEANTLTYAGNTLEVAHEDYLLVDNDGFLTAVKSGRMQHWSVETEPVRFPGVPAAVVVPAVGQTLKFEKTLLDPSDAPNLEAEYTWEGETR